MSNVYARHALGIASGGPTVALQLNGPAAWALPGGSNLATLSTSAGDLRMTSAGGGGLAVQALTGAVGVGVTAPTAGYGLDVSGSVNVRGGVRAAS